jgi:hypothetical protein
MSFRNLIFSGEPWPADRTVDCDHYTLCKFFIVPGFRLPHWFSRPVNYWSLTGLDLTMTDLKWTLCIRMLQTESSPGPDQFGPLVFAPSDPSLTRLVVWISRLHMASVSLFGCSRLSQSSACHSVGNDGFQIALVIICLKEIPIDRKFQLIQRRSRGEQGRLDVFREQWQRSVLYSECL